MLDRVARLPGTTCLIARGTRLGGIGFLHVNGSCRAIPACHGGAREFFRSYHLPVFSAEQNDSQSEEINVIDESQTENRPVVVQEAEIKWKKVPLVGLSVWLLCLAAAQKRAHACPLTVMSRLGELHVKAGYVSTLLAGLPG